MKVIIICGGNSLEKEISVKTGMSVHKSLKKTFETQLLFLNDNYKQIENIYNKGDVVFNALHGGYGENGQIQSFFEAEKINFIGSGSKACQSAISKDLCKSLAQSIDIQVPYGKKIKSGDFIYNDFEKPFIIKPDHEGSSVGFFKISSESEDGELVLELMTSTLRNVAIWSDEDISVSTIFTGPFASQIKESAKELGLTPEMLVWYAVKAFIDVGSVS